jgi:protein-S-isoprenylcysteine O-methyltransferase Ste14
MNSKVLVALQFLSIAVIMIPKQSMMITPFWWLFLLVAAVVAVWIFMHNKLGNFNVVPEIREQAKLVVTGPYRYVRHPMYSTLILFMFGVVLWHFSWINILALSIMIVAVVLKALREEGLWHLHHDDYADYKNRTKMILPFIF